MVSQPCAPVLELPAALRQPEKNTPSWSMYLADVVDVCRLLLILGTVCGFSLNKSAFCLISGQTKQYIIVDTIFTYWLHFGLPGTCLYSSPQNTHVWRRLCIFWTVLKTCSWKSKMKLVVKYHLFIF